MNLILKWIQWPFLKKTWGRKNQLHGTRASNVKSDQLQEKRAPRSFSPKAAESVERSAAGIPVQSGSVEFYRTNHPKGLYRRHRTAPRQVGGKGRVQQSRGRFYRSGRRKPQRAQSRFGSERICWADKRPMRTVNNSQGAKSWPWSSGGLGAFIGKNYWSGRALNDRPEFFNETIWPRRKNDIITYSHKISPLFSFKTTEIPRDYLHDNNIVDNIWFKLTVTKLIL